MSASVDIYTEKAENAVTVPIQCVTARELEEDEKKELDKEFKEVAFIVTEADTVRMLEVKTGIQDNEYIQITEGISAGDKIVTGPYSAISEKLEEGDRVYEKKKDNDKEKKSGIKVTVN
jgi:HlyD family secretion protein